MTTHIECIPESASRYMCDRAENDGTDDSCLPSMSLADFVETKFIPEHVAHKRPAGRAHFYGMLKHIVSPERVDRAFQANTRRPKPNPSADWTYMDSVRLCDVTRERIEDLIAGLMHRGYSIQTATHIRNVLRSIFTHAINAGCFAGTNPATLVALPAMARKAVYSLTMDQLNQVMMHLQSPEREIALISLFTEMRVAEICGLQWKYVNLSGVRTRTNGDWLPPMMIAVRKQSYRAQVTPVMEPRRRNHPIPELLSYILAALRARSRFTGPEDFVLASRNGTPICQENLGARKLKKIGIALDMPWLSWDVFHRTHFALISKSGRDLQQELKRAISLKTTLISTRRNIPGNPRTEQ
jgi:integrase